MFDYLPSTITMSHVISFVFGITVQVSFSNHLTSLQALQKCTSDTIKCVVCKRRRVYREYRRHYFNYVNNGEIPLQKIHEFLFVVRSQRCYTKYENLARLQLGYSRCNFRNKLNVECNRIVMDIERHLVSVHKLDKFGFKFEKLAIEIWN